jgi:hypothetical protein
LNNQNSTKNTCSQEGRLAPALSSGPIQKENSSTEFYSCQKAMSS